MKSVYLDNAATTPLDSRVLQAMMPYLSEDYANANSPHHLGRRTHVAIEEARETIARCIGAEPAEIIFTSGGTESNNAAIKGCVKSNAKTHIITSKVEHHAVLHPLQLDIPDNVSATFLDVNSDGVVTAEQVESAITPQTRLVSLMHGNNEISSLNPIREIAGICAKKNILFHSDTVQTVGKIPVDVNDLGVDFLSISAHKLYGPKGVGALFVRSGSDWHPWMHGGSQERKRRGGTLNVPGIIGLAEALRLAVEEMDANNARISALKTTLISELQSRFGESISFNGDLQNGLYNIVNCSFPMSENRALDGEMLLLNLDIEGICCSNGSACTSGAVEASHVLLAMGRATQTAKSSLRFSLGKHNTHDEIMYTVEKLEKIIHRMTQNLSK